MGVKARREAIKGNMIENSKKLWKLIFTEQGSVKVICGGQNKLKLHEYWML